MTAFVMAAALSCLLNAESDREQSLQVLLERHADAESHRDNQMDAEASRAQRAAMHFALQKQAMALRDQAMALYRDNPADEIGFKALLFAMGMNPHGGLSPEICQAITAHHLNNPRIYLAFSGRQSLKVFNKECEQLLKVASVNGVSTQVKEVAQVRLAAIYRVGSAILANMSELKMTPEQYITSEARARNEMIPLPLLEKLRQHSRESELLGRDWRVMREQALALAEPLVNSQSQLVEYRFERDGLIEVPGSPVSEEATKVAFQIQRAMPGAVLTDFGAVSLDGAPVSIYDHRNKIVLLELWATWCKPCISGMQELRSLKRELQGRPFEVITVSLDKSPMDVQEFKQKVSMPFENWYIGENESFMKLWPISPLPKRFVVDGNGVIRAVPRLGYNDLRNYVVTLVNDLAD